MHHAFLLLSLVEGPRYAIGLGLMAFGSPSVVFGPQPGFLSEAIQICVPILYYCAMLSAARAFFGVVRFTYARAAMNELLLGIWKYGGQRVVSLLQKALGRP